MARRHNLDIYPHTGGPSCIGCVNESFEEAEAPFEEEPDSLPFDEGYRARRAEESFGEHSREETAEPPRVVVDARWGELRVESGTEVTLAATTHNIAVGSSATFAIRDTAEQVVAELGTVAGEHGVEATWTPPQAGRFTFTIEADGCAANSGALEVIASLEVLFVEENTDGGTGEPISGLALSASGSDAFSAEGKTDASGVLRLEGVPEGTVRLEITALPSADDVGGSKSILARGGAEDDGRSERSYDPGGLELEPGRRYLVRVKLLTFEKLGRLLRRLARGGRTPARQLLQRFRYEPLIDLARRGLAGDAANDASKHISPELLLLPGHRADDAHVEAFRRGYRALGHTDLAETGDFDDACAEVLARWLTAREEGMPEEPETGSRPLDPARETLGMVAWQAGVFDAIELLEDYNPEYLEHRSRPGDLHAVRFPAPLDANAALRELETEAADLALYSSESGYVHPLVTFAPVVEGFHGPLPAEYRLRVHGGSELVAGALEEPLGLRALVPRGAGIEMELDDELLLARPVDMAAKKASAGSKEDRAAAAGRKRRFPREVAEDMAAGIVGKRHSIQSTPYIGAEWADKDKLLIKVRSAGKGGSMPKAKHLRAALAYEYRTGEKWLDIISKVPLRYVDTGEEVTGRIRRDHLRRYASLETGLSTDEVDALFGVGAAARIPISEWAKRFAKARKHRRYRVLGYEEDDDTPPAAYKEVVDEVVRFLKKHKPGSAVRIEGHTSYTARWDFNEELALARAERFEEKLVAALDEAGLEPGTDYVIHLLPLGERYVLDDTDRYGDLASQRRVEVTVHGDPTPPHEYALKRTLERLDAVVPGVGPRERAIYEETREKDGWKAFWERADVFRWFNHEVLPEDPKVAADYLDTLRDAYALRFGYWLVEHYLALWRQQRKEGDIPWRTRSSGRAAKDGPLFFRLPEESGRIPSDGWAWGLIQAAAKQFRHDLTKWVKIAEGGGLDSPTLERRGLFLLEEFLRVSKKKNKYGGHDGPPEHAMGTLAVFKKLCGEPEEGTPERKTLEALKIAEAWDKKHNAKPGDFYYKHKRRWKCRRGTWHPEHVAEL